MHIPFCRAKCRYCDFYSLPFEAASAEQFVQAVLAELSARASGLHLPLSSVYFGGGTPTALGTELLRPLLQAVQPLLCQASEQASEFTVEANPGTLDQAMAQLLAGAGVNRVNLGVQSLQSRELHLLGRIHGAQQARHAVDTLRQAGMENIGIDLIYGIPGQTLHSWADSLDQALRLRIEHLSCYALSFEPGTPLKRDSDRGLIDEMPEELQRDCYYAAIQAASQAGLEHYEISNFARPGRQSRHNLAYWHNEPYLGIGPAAASYIDGLRLTNQSDLGAYVASVLSSRAAEAPVASAERLTGRRAMAETLMLGLRLLEGVDRRAFADRFGQDPVDAFNRAVRRYVQLSALVVTPDRLRIAEDALFVADSILADILAEAGE